MRDKAKSMHTKGTLTSLKKCDSSGVLKAPINAGGHHELNGMSGIFLQIRSGGMWLGASTHRGSSHVGIAKVTCKHFVKTRQLFSEFILFRTNKCTSTNIFQNTL